MVKNILAVSTACLFLLAGCGGGSSSNNEAGSQPDTGTGQDTDTDTANILTGIFVDSAVEGASYLTASQSGTTNSNGEFSYLAGEQVVFSIGDTVLPSVAAAPQVSPVDMGAGASNPENTTTNIARLLQSLDTDGNPDNGISISSEAAAQTATINFDVNPEVFENDATVINLVANSGSVNTGLIPAADAMAHLNETLGISDTTSINGLWIRNAASNNETALADYSFVDGLNLSRYNSTAEGCYTISTNTATALGDNRYQLNADNGPVFYSAVRVGDTLEVTFDGEATLVYPRANGVDRNALPLCDAQNNNPSSDNFSSAALVDGSPWYAIRDFGRRDRPDTCGNKYSFSGDGSLTVIFKGIDETSFQTFNGTYTLTEAGVLTLLGEGIDSGQTIFQLNDLSSASWSVNRPDNNDAGAYLETAFSDRASAITHANSLGTNCEFNLPM